MRAIAIVILLLASCTAEIGGPAVVADAGVDAPVIDSGSTDATVDFALLCSQSYGQAPGYIACDATAETCTFHSETNQGNCMTMCSMLGGTCVGAFDNDATPGLECMPIAGSLDDCLTNRGTEICVCNQIP